MLPIALVCSGPHQWKAISEGMGRTPAAKMPYTTALTTCRVRQGAGVGRGRDVARWLVANAMHAVHHPVDRLRRGERRGQGWAEAEMWSGGQLRCPSNLRKSLHADHLQSGRGYDPVFSTRCFRKQQPQLAESTACSNP